MAKMKSKSGDCAKLRVALFRAQTMLQVCCWPDGTDMDGVAQLMRYIDDALAAPPRNCDKVKTSWDVLKEWHEGLDTANDVVRLLDWLLAPATEQKGGAK